MALRRLVNMLAGLGVNRDPTLVRNDQQIGVLSDRLTTSFLEQATVESAQQSGVVVTWRGLTTDASLATDEPLSAGQQCWVIQADDGTLLVLGSVK